jgi:hypothetical protein
VKDDGLAVPSEPIHPLIGERAGANLHRSVLGKRGLRLGQLADLR